MAERMLVEAQRMVANNRLDTSCIRFSDRLKLAVNKDVDAARYKRFFRVTPWKFVRQPLQDQVREVDAGLTTDEPELAAERAHLAFWSGEAKKALEKEPLTRLATGALNEQREQLVAELTAERDALDRDLDEVAEAKGLGRGWAAGFFFKG